MGWKAERKDYWNKTHPHAPHFFSSLNSTSLLQHTHVPIGISVLGKDAGFRWEERRGKVSTSRVGCLKVISPLCFKFQPLRSVLPLPTIIQARYHEQPMVVEDQNRPTRPATLRDSCMLGDILRFTPHPTNRSETTGRTPAPHQSALKIGQLFNAHWAIYLKPGFGEQTRSQVLSEALRSNQPYKNETRPAAVVGRDPLVRFIGVDNTIQLMRLSIIALFPFSFCASGREVFSSTAVSLPRRPSDEFSLSSLSGYIGESLGHIYAPIFSYRFPLPKICAYSHFTPVKWAPDFCALPIPY